jgi:hypothetical protein
MRGGRPQSRHGALPKPNRPDDTPPSSHHAAHPTAEPHDDQNRRLVSGSLAQPSRAPPEPPSRRHHPTRQTEFRACRTEFYACRTEFDPCRAEFDPCRAKFDPCRAKFSLCRTEFELCRTEFDPCRAEFRLCDRLHAKNSVRHGLNSVRHGQDFARHDPNSVRHDPNSTRHATNSARHGQNFLRHDANSARPHPNSVSEVASGPARTRSARRSGRRPSWLRPRVRHRTDRTWAERTYATAHGARQPPPALTPRGASAPRPETSASGPTHAKLARLRGSSTPRITGGSFRHSASKCSKNGCDIHAFFPCGGPPCESLRAVLALNPSWV